MPDSPGGAQGRARLNRWWGWVRRGVKVGVLVGLAVGLYLYRYASWEPWVFEDEESPVFVLALFALDGAMLGGLGAGGYRDWVHVRLLTALGWAGADEG
jgi:hypothetical protein